MDATSVVYDNCHTTRSTGTSPARLAFVPTVIDRVRLTAIVDRERAAFAAANPRSQAAAGNASHLFGGVPMTWMAKAATPFPLFLDRAKGARVTTLDGHELVDFCLGDTGAMAGHSPGAVVDAVARRYAGLGGATAMMPTEDAEAVAAELARRFGLPNWSFSLSATDANRWAIRLARAATLRSKVLINPYSYHGSVDESFAVADPQGRAVLRAGNVGAPVDIAETTRVAEYNDLDALERELAHGDVAAVLIEPAMTNMGIVLPDAGYLDGVRALTRAAGTLLIVDETHTFSAGPGGCTALWGLDPDIVTLGKSIGGGVPIGAYGLSAELAHRLWNDPDLDLVDTGGVGGTLAGNALSMAAARATLERVLTDEAHARMTALASRYADGVRAVIAAHDLPWTVTQLGARAELRFTAPAPRNGTESHAASDDVLDDWLHLVLVNRGVLLTPFHAMTLMCPATTEADVDLHLGVLQDAVGDLTA